MKYLKKLIPLVITAFLLGSSGLFAQKKGGHGGKGHGHRHGHKHVGHTKVIVKPSRFRPGKVVVYRPMWGPKHNIHRRWVFFPKYNMYWDNWRNHYVFWNGSIWFSQPTPPPIVVNVNLENEKHVELKENDDDNDDVYKGNDTHKTEYKPE